MRQRMAALVVVTILLFPLVATGGALAAGAAGNDLSGDQEPSGPNATDVTAKYQLDELRRGGTQIFPSSAGGGVGIASARYIGYEGSAAVYHKRAQLFGASATPLEPEQTVDRNQITLLSSMNRDVDDYTVTLHIVYWRPGERQIEGDDGSTRSVPIATEIQEQTVELELDGGYATHTVDLLEHYDREVQVTMWMTKGGAPVDGARWRFAHHSNEASAAIPWIDSRGDLWAYVGANVLIVSLVGLPIGGWKAKTWVRRAGSGPLIPPVIYAVLGFIALFVGGWVAYFQMAEYLTVAPWLIGLFVVGFGTLVMLEIAGRDTEFALFERDDLTAGRGPTGEERPGVLRRQLARPRIVPREDGKLELIKPGPVRFLARLWATGARIDPSEHNAEIRASGAASRVFRADPTTDLDELWTPAHFGLKVSGWPFLIGFVGVLVASLWVGGTLSAALAPGFPLGLPIAAVALLVFLVATIEARDGEIAFVPAPIHDVDSLGILAYAQREYRNASTLDEAAELIAEERAGNQRELEEIIDARDETLIQEAWSGGEPSGGRRERRKSAFEGNGDGSESSDGADREPSEIESTIRSIEKASDNLLGGDDAE